MSVQNLNDNKISLTDLGGIDLAPNAAGTIYDIALETEWVSGTILNADFGSATVQSNDMYGTVLDFNTNLAGVTDLDITVHTIKLPALTQSTANTTNYIGWNLPTAGALIQNTLAGTINWKGINLQLPNSTQTTGTVNSYGIYITGGTVTSGTQYGIYTTTSCFFGAVIGGDITISDATPVLNFKDTSCADSDVNASIQADATDTGSGSEDIDVTFQQQKAGVATTYLVSDADGSMTIGLPSQAVAFNTSALSGVTSLAMGGALSGVTTLAMAGDLTDYEATNDANPQILLGSADAEELHIQVVYDGGAQTLNYVQFTTDVASATADKGKYVFNVDGSDIATIDDGGMEITGSVNATAGFTDGIMTIDGSGAITGVTSLAMGGALSGVTTLGLSQGITQNPTVTGTLYSLDLSTEWTTGTLYSAGFLAGTTQTGSITGFSLNFNTNLTGATDCDITGYKIQTPAFTHSAATMVNYIGYQVIAGALVQNTLAGTINWKGASIQCPDITQTTGTVNSYGLYLNGGTVTSGTEWVILVDKGNSRFDGEITIGNDADNVSGKINFIASDGDAADISINTSDQLLFANASGGYQFDSYGAFAMGGAPITGVSLFVGANNTTMPAGTTAWRHIQTGGNVTELAGATITDIVGAYFNTFTITDGGGVETVGFVATVYINNAPTAGTAPTIGTYALFVDAGEVRIDGALGDTTNRVSAGWFTDLTVTNTIAGSINGNAATATALQNTRTIWGQNFNGTANVTGAISSATTIGMAGDLTNYEATNDANPEFRLGSADAEELHIQVVYDGGAQTLNYVQFTTDVASATADKGKYIFNVDGTDIATIDDGGMEITGSVNATAGFTDGTMTIDGSGAITGVTSLAMGGALSGVTTLAMAGDLTDYEATNDANPQILLGSADAEELHIQVVYDGGAQTLNYVQFTTDVASATADKGKYVFNVDGSDIATIDDGGMEITGSVNATAGFTDGTMTIDGSGAITGVTSLAMGGALSGVTTLGLSQGITQNPTVTGTLYSLDLSTEWTTGTLYSAGFLAGTTQTGSITGFSLNFSTNLTGATDCDITGYKIQTPAFTHSAATMVNYIGYQVIAGALVQNTLAGTINWKGISIQCPDITQTTGTVNSYGLYLNGGTVTSGTEWVILVDKGNSRFDGEITIGNDADNVSGKINFIASDGDAADISINTSDQLLFANASGGYLFDSAIIGKQGTDIASASTIVIPSDGNVFELTGTTTVNLITKTGYQDGFEITLITNESVTINHGTATAGDNITILLSGAGNFSMTANDTLTLVLSTTTANGQAWREKSRTSI